MATSNVQRLEQTRAVQLANMNRLETELRGQEVTITTLGHYINTLAYDKPDIDLPNDILRILNQINVLQRRKSNGVTKPKTTTPRKLKSTVSSPDFGDRVSRIFRRNNLQIFTENGDSETDDDSLFTKSLSTKSLSDTKGIGSKLKEKQPADQTQSSPSSLTRNGSLGRILTREDIESLKKIAEKQSDKNVSGRKSSINIQISEVDENSNVGRDSNELRRPAEETAQGSASQRSHSEGQVHAGSLPLEDEASPPENPKAQNSLKARKISTGYLRRSTSASNVSAKPLPDLNANPVINTRNYSKHPLDSIENNIEGPNQLKGFTTFSINQKTSNHSSSPDFPSLTPPPGSKKLQESLLNNNDVSSLLTKKTDFANSDKLASNPTDVLFNRSDLLSR